MSARRYHDFKIEWVADRNVLAKTLTTAKDLGYTIVALNKTFKFEDEKPRPEMIPKPPELTELLQNQNLKGLKLFTRLTVVLKNFNQIHIVIRSAVAQSYNILALQPTDEKLFQKVCEETECDIVTCDLTERLTFSPKSTLLNVAARRNISLEITYAAACRDRGIRRNVISQSNDILRFVKGKNVILSSEAVCCLGLRAPQDVANLGRLFGIGEQYCTASVSTNGTKLLNHIEARNSCKGVLTLKEKLPTPTDDQSAQEDEEVPSKKRKRVAKQTKGKQTKGTETKGKPKNVKKKATKKDASKLLS